MKRKFLIKQVLFLGPLAKIIGKYFGMKLSLLNPYQQAKVVEFFILLVKKGKIIWYHNVSKILIFSWIKLRKKPKSVQKISLTSHHYGHINYLHVYQF